MILRLDSMNHIIFNPYSKCGDRLVAPMVRASVSKTEC